MEFRDFADYWRAYAWATHDYLQKLSESASIRLTERVRAAYVAGAAHGPPGIHCDGLGCPRCAFLRSNVSPADPVGKRCGPLFSLPFAGAGERRCSSTSRL